MLRRASEPMTTKQIALQVMASRGQNTEDAALVLTITRRVGASLRSYRDNGSIKSIKDGRYGKYDLCGNLRAKTAVGERDAAVAGLSTAPTAVAVVWFGRQQLGDERKAGAAIFHGRNPLRLLLRPLTARLFLDSSRR